MESDIERVVDEAEIRRVLHVVFHAIDRDDAALLESFFDPRCVDCRGEDATALLLHHLVTNMLIEVDNDVAATQTYVITIRVAAADGRFEWCAGRYLDRLERHDRRWRIIARRYLHDIDMPVAAEEIEAAPTSDYDVGSRSDSDSSHALFSGFDLRRPIGGVDDTVALMAVADLCSRYAQASDRADVAVVAASYHADGIEEHGPHFAGLGTDFAAWIGEQQRHFPVSTHHLTTRVIGIDREHAVAESSMFGLVTTDTGRVSWSSGRYLDHVERRDGEWKLARRQFVKDIAFPVPLHIAGGAVGDATRVAESRPIRAQTQASHELFESVASGRPWPAAN